MRIVHQHRGTAQQPDGDLAALPPHTLERLHAEGVYSVADWRRLSRKRRGAIFGVTKATVALLDAAARETSA